MRRVAIILLAAAVGGWAWAAAIEGESLTVEGAQVVKVAGASAGAALRFDLEQARSGVIASLPLPGPIAPGKYALSLRVQFDPVDAYSDSFTVGVGETDQSFMPTDFPDPQASDWRVWTVPVVVAEAPAALVIRLDRPSSYAEPKTRALLLDSVNLQPQGGAVFLASVRPNKVMYLPGEEARAEMLVRNVGATAAERRIRLLEVRDLGIARQVGQQTVSLPPGEEQTLSLTWKIGPDEYGREIRAEMLDARGKVFDQVSEYVHVADNVWKVAMRGPHGPHMTHPDSTYCGLKTPEAWQEYITKTFPAAIRATYGNFTEWFAWAPDDAFYMTPTEETWISGQGCYQHMRSRVLDLNRVLNEHGVWPITYAKSAASGPPCYEFMRKHPEWGLGRYQVQFDQQYVRDWNKQIPGQDKTVFYTWVSLVLNITIPEIVDTAINEILDSAEMFGWRGARYDDHYTYWGQPYHELSTRNMQRIFDLGKQRNPGFVWGFNYITMGTSCVWPGKPLEDLPWKQQHKEPGLVPDPAPPRFEKMPEVFPELKIACENGAYIMNEEARGAHGGTYTNYARLLTHEARLVRGLGGHYGPIPFDPQPQSAFNNVYPDILRAASRAHTYGDIRGGTRFRQFLTRYSAFIYGTALAPITDPEAMLTVEATPGVWWHMFAYTYKAPGVNRVLVHLLSVPPQDKISENKQGVVRKVTDVAVTYKGPGTVVQAWELSPFLSGWSRPLSPQGKTVKPSDFHLWKIVVLELRGGA